MQVTTAIDRLAGAPISWGVCEVPGWGPALSVERVLGEMRELGLRATELGAAGYLGATPGQVKDTLARFDLRALGGFQPLVLHDAGTQPATLRQAADSARLLAGTGARYFVTAVVADAAWSRIPSLDDAGWDTLTSGLDAVDGICAEHGLTQVLHPHLGTLVESRQQVERVLRESPVRWCLDTGHLALGGMDPVAFAEEHGARVELVHAKDALLVFGPRLLAGELSLLQATRQGVFRPLGDGDIPVERVIGALEQRGYRGWYVIEQDVSIEGDPALADPAADVARSLRRLDAMVSRP